MSKSKSNATVTATPAPVTYKGTSAYRKQLRSACRNGLYPVAIQQVKGGYTVHAVIRGVCHPLWTDGTKAAALDRIASKLKAMPSELRSVFGSWRFVTIKAIKAAA